MAYSNGYANGATNGSLTSFRRFDLHDSSRENSADERSRSRPGNTNHQPSSEQVHAISRLERNRPHRRSRDYNAELSPSRSRNRYGASSTQVDAILRYIESHFPFMASSSCVPVKVALQLTDPSSLGLQDQTDDFNEAHTQLQNALKVIVNEHHQGFNSSIGTFHKIQTAIQTSQARVRLLRQGLVDARRDLIGSQQRPEVRTLAVGSQNYEGMLSIIATIEQIQLVPERLEAQIREKRYLGAVESLLEALALIRKPELEEIGALSELRVHLSNQEQILTDLLVEELHNHLYLKSPYCEERWKGHMRRSATDTEDERGMYIFLSTYDGRQPLEEDTSRNPEADTFAYINLLIESLNKLSRLDLAADKIEERLPVELFKVLERTLSEVEQRHPQSLIKRRQQHNNINASPDAEQRATLEDLLAMLYAKFEAIAEGHRVLHDVTSAILKRDLVPASESTTLNRSFRELWKLLQSEIRSLLHDHLATNSSVGGSKSNQHNNASANIFRPQPRDRNRKLFKLQDTIKPGKDGKVNADLTLEREDLEFILRSSVPGLVNTPQKSTISGDDDVMTDRSATGHKLLLEPSIFNMGILLPATQSFLSRLKDIVPSGFSSGTLTSFLDDFLTNVFLPQLDETLLEMCGRCMSDHDAFAIDPRWAEVAAKPIYKGTRGFWDVMEAVCRLLDHLPHQQDFALLVIGVMRAFYDRCYSWSKNLLQRVASGEDGEVKMKLAAALATDGEVNAVVIELVKADDEKERTVLAEKESELLLRMSKRGEFELEDGDLISDRKALAALCTLQVSMKWMATKCKALRYISPYAIDSDTDTSLTKRTSHAPSESKADTIFLPLSQQTAPQFDAVTQSLTELSSLILRTLQIDIRLHLLHGISTALSTTYALGQPYNDPDPAILRLSGDLNSYWTTLTTNLLTTQQDFLTQNIHTLANTSLVVLVTSIPAIDSYGFARMALNILVLQQTLKPLYPPSDLQKAAYFYELGAAGPERVIKAKDEKDGYGFSIEDLKSMIRLCYDEVRDKELGEREAVAMRLGGWPARKASLKGRGRGGRSPRTPVE